MKRFTCYRPQVPTTTHDEFQRNEADAPQYEGVVFSDGRCVLRWLTAVGSTSVWDDWESMLRIHGHPEYGTYFVFHDGDIPFPTWWAEREANSAGFLG